MLSSLFSFSLFCIFIALAHSLEGELWLEECETNDIEAKANVSINNSSYVVYFCDRNESFDCAHQSVCLNDTAGNVTSFGPLQMNESSSTLLKFSDGSRTAIITLNCSPSAPSNFTVTGNPTVNNLTLSLNGKDACLSSSSSNMSSITITPSTTTSSTTSITPTPSTNSTANGTSMMTTMSTTDVTSMSTMDITSMTATVPVFSSLTTSSSISTPGEVSTSIFTESFSPFTLPSSTPSIETTSTAMESSPITPTMESHASFIPTTATSSLPTSTPAPSPSLSATDKILITAFVSIPCTALITVLIMLLFCYCCKKKGRSRSTYVRLAPTVFFDDEDS